MWIIKNCCYKTRSQETILWRWFYFLLKLLDLTLLSTFWKTNKWFHSKKIPNNNFISTTVFKRWNVWQDFQMHSWYNIFFSFPIIINKYQNDLIYVRKYERNIYLVFLQFEILRKINSDYLSSIFNYFAKG